MFFLWAWAGRGSLGSAGADGKAARKGGFQASTTWHQAVDFLAWFSTPGSGGWLLQNCSFSPGRYVCSERFWVQMCFPKIKSWMRGSTDLKGKPPCWFACSAVVWHSLGVGQPYIPGSWWGVDGYCPSCLDTGTALIPLLGSFASSMSSAGSLAWSDVSGWASPSARRKIGTLGWGSCGAQEALLQNSGIIQNIKPCVFFN